MAAAAPRRPQRQDTFDLRNEIVTDDDVQMSQHADVSYQSDEEHSVLEDDSDGEERDGEYMDDDDGSSSLSIPNESIDFDLVYSLHSFAATVEGQANVVKGDSLFLMDDSNSYWWLVRVLKTQEVGYIPAENIETPFERLARLNKHRNVDLASATQAEVQQGKEDASRLMTNASTRIGASPSPTPRSQNGSRQSNRRNKTRSVVFGTSFSVHRYAPAIWHDDETDDEDDVEWDDESYEGEADYDEEEETVRPNDLPPQAQPQQQGQGQQDSDDGMSWEPDVGDAMQQRQQQQQMQAQMQAQQQMQQQQQMQMQQQQGMRPPPAGVRFGQAPNQMIQQQQQQQQVAGQPAQVQSQAQFAAQQQQQQDGMGLRKSASRDQMQVDPTSPTSPTRPVIDPATITETRKVSVTPTIAQDGSLRSQGPMQAPGADPARGVAPGQGQGPMLPSSIMAIQQQQSQEESKRTREEVEALEAEARKRSKAGGNGAPGVGGAPPSGPGRSPTGQSMEAKQPAPSGGSKLRKEQPTQEEDKDKKKKSGGILGGLFGRKKDKKEKGASSVTSESEDGGRRVSEESGSTAHGPQEAVMTLSAASPYQQQAQVQQQQSQQQLQQPSAMKGNRNSTNPRMGPVGPVAPGMVQQGGGVGPGGAPMISAHASQLRQRDQQQQALYQQYLNRSPASPPDMQPNYGLQSASAVLNTGHSREGSGGPGMGLSPAVNASKGHGRPGSLILSPTSADGSGVGVPELSVIRVFAGKNMQTEATFKTVLLNTSTTSSDLVRQAMQRFRLGAGEDESEYFLTAKQVEGGRSMVLRAEEHPLVVFDSLVEAAMELPKVKRSSVGSISSVASNLSMHPAIKRLDMNDFSDDSAVKFYLNRKNEDGGFDDSLGEAGDDTLVSDATQGDEGRSQYLTVNGATGIGGVSSERFSSPSFRFALQVNVYPDDLPDDMVFDPHTEALIFKHTLRERGHAGAMTSPGISTEFRRKVFILPKNVTVAEVIELALERFGILEGVVDGGDEVEDKQSKRKSTTRVRYGLTVRLDGQEKELSPTGKVIEAFPRAPSYRAPERRPGETKRRSADASLLLGSVDDIQTEDPVFVLRRSVSYRTTSKHNRLSAPLDELALSHLHRESSVSSTSEDPVVEEKKPMSRQELIAAQRAASRANQRALLGANANSQRGVDLLLPDKAVLRSSRYDADNQMRYSYVLPDGETYDVTDIVQDEWRGEISPQRETNGSGSATPQGSDLLESVYQRNKDGSMDDRIDRVISKIKDGKHAKITVPEESSIAEVVVLDPPPSASASAYSTEELERDAPTPTPTNAEVADAMRSQSPTPNGGLFARPELVRQETARSESPASSGATTPILDSRGQRVRSTTPTSRSPYMNGHGQPQPSIASLLSDASVYRTAPSTPLGIPLPQSESPAPAKKMPVVLKDEFGMTNLLAIIDSHAMTRRSERLPRLEPAEAALFGHSLNPESLHPDVKEGFAETFKNMAEMDRLLDAMLQKHLAATQA